MSIQKLQIKGFRSLEDITWEPGKLNVVIGPNGSGKSNLLRALSFLQHAANGELPHAVLQQGGIALYFDSSNVYGTKLTSWRRLWRAALPS